ncbi:hypothetical protein BpHYR1_032473 [Brachionus plicatilis]|uniref:Uncharacterized protein n=1 Tax=Brachionus plicatilis TaxID=10195 RepID=A0A3M7T9M9_BRAPC|nr:hypothetical protein BpHYR1_032473 [Brachionus plicatilis]
MGYFAKDSLSLNLYSRPWSSFPNWPKMTWVSEYDPSRSSLPTFCSLQSLHKHYASPSTSIRQL